MAEETAVVEEVSTTEEAPEKSKKGLVIILIIIGLVAIIQCAALFVIFQDEISAFFENMKPEPVEVVLYHPMQEMSVNLADKDTRHFLKATLTLQYNDETLATTVLTERVAEVESLVLQTLRSKTYDEIDSVKETQQLGNEIVATLNEAFETEGFTKVHFTNYLYQ